MTDTKNIQPHNDLHGSQADEKFARLQQQFIKDFKRVFPNDLSKKCVVVNPSITMDQYMLGKVAGHIYYEERLLCLLMLLRMPRTYVLYLSSMPIDPVIIDYYLQYLPGITREHALRRFIHISCYDKSALSLTEKILARPMVMQRIKDSIPHGYTAHMACFNVTPHERKLALELNMPIYGCDPALSSLGNKSNSRKIFRECGLQIPAGYEDLSSRKDVVDALVNLKQADATLTKAVIKKNEGFSGEGNALFSYEGLDAADPTLHQAIDRELSERLSFVADQENLESFLEDFEKEQGIVEAFVAGETKQSPSVQCRISPVGEVKVISTHDQVVGGNSGQVFLGAYLPAREDYAVALGKDGATVGEYLKNKGVLGRFSIDYISVKHDSGWHHYAIEINLRKGGTTHPYILLELLTDGDYDHHSGKYFTATGQERFYFASDNLKDNLYKGLTPPDLMDIAIINKLQYNGSTQEGVMFHLIGALSEHGKMGLLCIGSSHERACKFYEQTVDVLNRHCRKLENKG